MPEKFDFTAFLEEIADFEAPTGDEGRLADFLCEAAKKLGFDSHIDTAGSVTVHRPGSGKKVLVTTPMDEPGFLVKTVKDGFFTVEPISRIPASHLSGKTVKVKSPAVASNCPIHFSQTADKYPKIDEISFESPDPVSAGDFGVLCGRRAAAFGSGGFLYMGRAAASRACIAALFSLLYADAGNADLYFVFAACGRLFSKGAKIAAETIKPDFALLLRTCDKSVCGGSDAFDGQDPPLLAMPLIDSGAVHDAALRAFAGIAAEQNEYILKMPSERLTAQESTISQQCGGVRTLLLALPTRLIGSGSEYCRFKDAEALAHMAALCVGGIADGKV